jgi:predicted MPP superfamily phosphohydrolase
MLAAMLLFGLVFTIILLGAAWVAAASWSRFMGLTSLWWILVPMLLWGSFVPLLIFGRVLKGGFFDALVTASSVLLGFLNYAFFAALACWVVWIVVKLGGFALPMKTVAIALYGLAILTTLYGLANAATLRTVRETVRIPNLSAAWQGRDVALVSDIHIGSIHSRAFVAKVVKKLNTLAPYAVFIPGDMFDGPEAEPDKALEPWKDLQALGGGWVVSGNHDEFGNRAPLLAAMKKAGLHVLDDASASVEGVTILGVHDGAMHNADTYADILRRLHIAPGAPAILLAHRPENLPVAGKAGVALQLSGHTHGGQFWPWNLVVNRIYIEAAHGLSRHGNLQLYTSYGAGTWGPPLRVGTRAEIVILHFEAEDAPAASTHAD